jgi:Spy/CpxP family protein refolding chaperone
MASCSRARQDRPSVLRVLVLVAVCLCAAVSVEARSAPYKWWLSHDNQAQLHLTAVQVRKIDEVFESSLPARRALRQELDVLERQLDALLESAAADDGDAAALITRVEAARARRNVARMVMLYRMRQILTPEQRRWFDESESKSSGP